MANGSLFIKKMAGFFPGAGSVRAFWEQVMAGQTPPLTKLDAYWGLDARDYEGPEREAGISMDYGHLASYEGAPGRLPRQIQAAVDIGEDLLDGRPGEERRYGLLLATAWTDRSYYDAALGTIPPDRGYSVERQLQTVKDELRLTGPALSVDAACASSLYAIDLGRGMLATSDIAGVLIIGLNLHLHAFLYRGLTKLAALSGRKALRPFDRGADGIVPGEAACGILVDRSFSGALAEICGIGLSADGNEGSVFTPGLRGQCEAYRRAYEDAGVTPTEVDYIEAHGTGTVLGDETETASVRDFFKPAPGRELAVGSSKSNAGHTLAASGLVSVIKAAMMIQTKTLPPHIRIDPSPAIKERNLKILEAPCYLDQASMTIGVSSFGFGGSNAHAVIRTPRPGAPPDPLPAVFFIKGLKAKDAGELGQAPPVLRDIAMGPKMQERIDALQRWSLSAVQSLVGRLDDETRRKLSCVFLNNLGGSLSLDFERKQRTGSRWPELSIEAIASTLPSMLSGHPAKLLNMRGHHMLVSGTNGSLGTVLTLCPYLLARAEGDIVLGVAHKNVVPSPAAEILAVMHLTADETSSPIAALERLASPGSSRPADHAEATGVKELMEILQRTGATEDLTVGHDSFRVQVSRRPRADLEALKESALQESRQNASIALDYLELLSRMTPGTVKLDVLGDFLAHAEKAAGRASAELVVDDHHPYFFDHALDHVPGILSIHGCEELLHWYLGKRGLISSLSIRFTKFLEKDAPIAISLREREPGAFEFDIKQRQARAGVLRATVRPLDGSGPSEAAAEAVAEAEDKRFLHKHRDENVLVSRLDREKDRVQALDLSPARGAFFEALGRPSAVYYAEVLRQFVMLLGHVRKGLPLSVKINLIATEISLSRWVRPPFFLALKDFTLTRTADFLFADVQVDFISGQTVFGRGDIKAQVVSAEYYQSQRTAGWKSASSPAS